MSSNLVLPNGKPGHILTQDDIVNEAIKDAIDVMNPENIPKQFNYSEKPSDDLMAAMDFKNPKQVNELKYIIKDILSGDNAAARDERYSYLNFEQIKTAIEWLQTNKFDEQLQQLILQRPWALIYKDKPPTPEEFLTHKYIGEQANSLWLPLRKAFLTYFDTNLPYRTAVLNPSIGVGKKVTVTSPIQVGYEDYYEIIDDSGTKYNFSEGQLIWHKNKYVSIEKLIGAGKLTLSKINYINMMVYDVEKTHLFDDAFNLKTYDSLIGYFKKVNDDIYAQWDIYTQKHHIVPRSEGGIDSEDNLVRLPYYFHLMAHYLRGKEAESIGDKAAQYKNYKAVCWALEENSLPKNVIEMHEKLQIVVESLEKRRQLEKQRVWITDGKVSQQIFSFEAIPEGWHRGRTFRSPASKKWVNKDGKSYYIEKDKVDEYLKNGYILGMFKTEKMKAHIERDRNKNKAGFTKGTKWMYKGKERKCVKLEEVDTFKKDGWTLGHNYKSSWTKGAKAAVHKDNTIKYIDKEKVNDFLSSGWKIGTGYNSYKGTFNDDN